MDRLKSCFKNYDIDPTLKSIQRDLFIFRSWLISLYGVNVGRFGSNHIKFSQQGRTYSTPCWKHILKFEPNLTTFYY